jgi:hypothetical protein
MLQLLVTANIVPSSLILVTMMMEVIQFSKVSRATQHISPEDDIPQYSGILDFWTFSIMHILKVDLSSL